MLYRNVAERASLEPFVNVCAGWGDFAPCNGNPEIE